MAGSTVDTGASGRYKSGVPKKPENSRVPSVLGNVPVVGDLAKSAEAQARWLQELVEQNARLIGQLPATLKSFNDALERFNETVGRLDRAVSRIEAATGTLIGPLDKLVGTLDPKALRDLARRAPRPPS